MSPLPVDADDTQNAPEDASQPSAKQVLAVLRELVRLKDLKDRDGEIADYRQNKDAAWDAARRMLGQSKKSQDRPR